MVVEGYKEKAEALLEDVQFYRDHPNDQDVYTFRTVGGVREWDFSILEILAYKYLETQGHGFGLVASPTGNLRRVLVAYGMIQEGYMIETIDLSFYKKASVPDPFQDME